MSEELAPGAINLEETEIVGPTAGGKADDPPPDEPDGTITGSGGVKFVPLDAVRAERAKAKEAREETERLKQEAVSWREKAQKFDQIMPAVQQAMPIVEQVRNRPDILAALQRPAPQASSAAGPLTDDEAVEYAKDLDLYTPEGKPDVGRAQRLAARQEAVAKRQAAAVVAPLEAQTAAQQSTANLAAIENYRDSQGRKVDPRVIRQIWAIVPPELSARPEVAQLLHRQAIAEMVLQGGNFGTAVDPPALHTESVGGGAGAPAKLSAVEERIRQAADLTTKAYTAGASRYTPGAINSLED